MRVTMLGTGTSYPDPERVQSGIMVEQGTQRILFDIGSGVLHRLVQGSVNLDTITSIFISHFHIDHCSDLLTLYQSIWLSGKKRTLDVYGPPAIDKWLEMLFEQAYPYLQSKIMTNSHSLNNNETIQLDELTIRSAPTIHGPMDTRAFRVEADEKTVFYSSDTAPSRELNRLAKGADVLIHECNWLDGQHPQGVHTSPSELAEIVEETAPSSVVLTHVSPEVVRNEKQVVEIVKSKHDTKVFLAKDTMSFQI